MKKTKRLLNLKQHKTNHGRKLRFHRKILQTETYNNERKYRTESYKNIRASRQFSIRTVCQRQNLTSMINTVRRTESSKKYVLALKAFVVSLSCNLVCRFPPLPYQVVPFRVF